MKKITRFLKADIEYNKQEYEDVLEENIKITICTICYL